MYDDGQFTDDVAAVMETAAGARALARIVMFSRLYLGSYDPAEASSGNAIYREGMRNVGLFIYDAVRSREGGTERLTRAGVEIAKGRSGADGRDS